MSDLRDLLIRGSEKVIEHYRFLLGNAKDANEHYLYSTRIDREQALLDQLKGGFQDRSAAWEHCGRSPIAIAERLQGCYSEPPRLTSPLPRTEAEAGRA